MSLDLRSCTLSEEKQNVHIFNQIRKQSVSSYIEVVLGISDLFDAYTGIFILLYSMKKSYLMTVWRLWGFYILRRLMLSIYKYASSNCFEARGKQNREKTWLLGRPEETYQNWETFAGTERVERSGEIPFWPWKSITKGPSSYLNLELGKELWTFLSPGILNEIILIKISV